MANKVHPPPVKPSKASFETHPTIREILLLFVLNPCVVQKDSVLSYLRNSNIHNHIFCNRTNPEVKLTKLCGKAKISQPRTLPDIRPFRLASKVINRHLFSSLIHIIKVYRLPIQVKIYGCTANLISCADFWRYHHSFG